MASLDQAKKKCEALWEKWWPILSSAAAGIIFYRYVPDTMLTKAVSELPGVLVSVSAISVGFLATFRGILMSSTDRKFIRDLKTNRRKQYELFLKFMDRAMISSFALAVLSACFVFWEAEHTFTSLERTALSAWIALSVYTAAAAYRTLILNSKLLRYL